MRPKSWPTGTCSPNHSWWGEGLVKKGGSLALSMRMRTFTVVVAPCPSSAVTATQWISFVSRSSGALVNSWPLLPSMSKEPASAPLRL